MAEKLSPVEMRDLSALIRSRVGKEMMGVMALVQDSEQCLAIAMAGAMTALAACAALMAVAKGHGPNDAFDGIRMAEELVKILKDAQARRTSSGV